MAIWGNQSFLGLLRRIRIMNSMEAIGISIIFMMGISLILDSLIFNLNMDLKRRVEKLEEKK